MKLKVHINSPDYLIVKNNNILFMLNSKRVLLTSTVPYHLKYSINVRHIFIYCPVV